LKEQLLAAVATSGNDDDTATPGDAFSTLAHEPQQQLAAALAEVSSILKGPSIQARCLECPPVAPARIDEKDLTLLGLIKAWLS
jgi:protease IV